MNLSRLDYFAANAPEVPDWYRDQKKYENLFEFQKYFDSLLPQRPRLVSDAELEEAGKKTIAAQYEHERKLNAETYFSWRKHYAEQMAKMLPMACSVDEVSE